MDAQTIYRLLKPHLELMEPTEKRSLTQLISDTPESGFSSRHRKITNVTQAKEKLKSYCKRQMELERNKSTI